MVHIQSLVQYVCVLIEVKNPEAVLNFIVVFSNCVNVYRFHLRLVKDMRETKLRLGMGQKKDHLDVICFFFFHQNQCVQ